MSKHRLIVVVGPTSSGKSDFAVKLALRLRSGQAKKYGGEIVSADSRQVYKGLDIGSGKIEKKHMRGIPHHLLSIVSPKKIFTVAQYQKQARNILNDIWKRGKIPILCGGTGLYIQSVVDGIVIPEVKPNRALRSRLEGKSNAELFRTLQKIDPRRAKNIDQHNPRRLIRAIEIAKAIGSVPQLKMHPLDADIQFIGITLDAEELKKRIHKRLTQRLRRGMLAEIETLHRNGLSWKRLESFGLEYKYGAYYLQNKMSKKEFIKTLEKEIWRYAKRQMTWFKRDKRIQWVQGNKKPRAFLRRG